MKKFHGMFELKDLTKMIKNKIYGTTRSSVDIRSLMSIHVDK